ncbi:MAG: SMP-30/gluconolactonase/LRE family protein [Bacteroidales bacterium]|nr:SMP-30/gluconolactonase/LRE family protein [Bacteroidales bacterium]
MKKITLMPGLLITISAIAVFLLSNCVGPKNLFVAHDFTAENLFSVNIEGPAFDKNGQLYVVNYQHDGTIGKVAADGSCSMFIELPEGSIANCILFDKQDNMFLPDFTGHNILHVDMKTRQVSVFCNEPRMFSPNDLCMNRKGQIFASDPDWKAEVGQLWRIETDGKPVLLEKNMGTTNGIELSPDEKTLYVNESIQRKVWKYDVDPNGDISGKKLFYQFSDFGLDGMKCDKYGNLYITRWGKGTIVVVSPSGELIREISLKGKKCSNLVFGGKNGRTIFVTLQDRKCMEKLENDIPGKSY